MFKKDIKSKKSQLKHLNNIYPLLLQESINKGISEENRAEYINLLLKTYLESDKIIREPSERNQQ